MKANLLSCARACSLGLLLLPALAPQTATAAISDEIVFFDLPDALEPNPIPAPTPALAALPGYPQNANQLTLAAQLYTPDPAVSGHGPYPAVLILHGSGGLWSNDVIANGPISHLEEWGELLAGLGYLVLLPDSYNPRGIDGNFGSRRPHYDPNIDDDLCSPNYERPKDVVAALTYLAAHPDFDGENVALMGFSHGAQSAMNAVVDVSVNLGQYTVSYIDLVEIPNTNPKQYQEVTTTKDVASPVRIPDNLPFPKLGLFYYGGGSHYGYHGQASSIAAGRYMIDRRMQALLFHGTDDSLLGVANPNVTPMTGSLFPIKQALSSSAQALALGVADPIKHHFLLHLADHSFDLASIAPQIDWGTPNESPDQRAKRLCREESLKWIEYALKPAPSALLTPGMQAQEVDLTVPSSQARFNFQWRYSDDLVAWFDLGSDFDGDGGDAVLAAELGGDGRRFFQLEYAPIAPPLAANPGFFRDYTDFSY